VIQSFLDAYIGEDWLDDGQAFGIDQPALRRVYLGFHFIHQGGRLAFGWYHQVFAQHVRGGFATLAALDRGPAFGKSLCL